MVVESIQSAAQQPGLICTFYSYKGGVGRSMALANIAALLSQWGQRVLVVDWDLEAPGLERYFQRRGVRLKRDTVGLVDLATDWSSEKSFDWRKGLLRVSIPGGEPIMLLHSGHADEHYQDRLRSINWSILFDNGFGAALEAAREEWREEFDVILIDSRTGITDIGGICSILLPDYVVALFTANEQSLAGIKDAMQRARSVHACLPLDRQKLVVIPVPARDESNQEYERAAQWRRRFAIELSEFYEDWLPKSETSERALDLLKIPHVPYWSFGEPLPVLDEETDNPKTLAYSYALIARLLYSRLDWSQVRDGGGEVAAAAARQAAVVQARVAETERLRLQALENERRRAEGRLEYLRNGVYERYREVKESLTRNCEMTMPERYTMNSGGFGGVVVLLLLIYFLSSPEAAPLTPGFLAFVLCAFSISVGYVLLRFRHRRRVAINLLSDLRRERLAFEAAADSYASMDEIGAIRLFGERIENIYIRRLRAGMSVTDLVSSGEAAAVPAASPLIKAEASAQGQSALLDTPSPAPPANPDVALLYAQAPLTVDWLRTFSPLLQAWLGERLGQDAVVMELPLNLAANADATDTDWKKGLSISLSKARVVIVILSRRLFGSAFARRELEEAIKTHDNGCLIPIMLEHDLPPDEEVLKYLGFDFSDLAYVGEGFAKSERYLDFQDRVREVAYAVARIIGEQAEAGGLPEWTAPTGQSRSTKDVDISSVGE